MIDAAQEFGAGTRAPQLRVRGPLRFDDPRRRADCHFTMWKASDEEAAQWQGYTRVLERKAIAHARAGGDS